MTPTPKEQQNGDSIAVVVAAGGGAEALRSLPTPFLTKTYQIVDDPAVDDIISWNEDGSTFVVWRPAEFARDLLPKYFKHNNFSSFVRQLNTYGFRKIASDRWEFANDCFRRGEKKMLCDIHRRKHALPATVPTIRTESPSNSSDEQVFSSSPPVGDLTLVMCNGNTSSSSSSAVGLVEENDRLRKENVFLSHELSQMKGLCNSIFSLMTKYANRPDNGGGSTGKSPIPESAVSSALQEMDLVGQHAKNEPTEEERMEEEPQEELREPASPRLFGVPIRMKRRTREDEDQDLQLEMRIKIEPLDQGSSSPSRNQADHP